MLRCAQSLRYNVVKNGIVEGWIDGLMRSKPTASIFQYSNIPFPSYASEIFLSSLQAEFSSTLLETIAARGPALTHARARTGSPVNYRKFPTAINPHQSHTA
jgi:hypothetical protein